MAPSAVSSAMNSAWKSATDIGARSNLPVRPSLAEPITAWSRRSSTISTLPGASGTADVVKPARVT